MRLKLLFVILAIAFGLANFLHDDLLCRLRGNPPIFEGWQWIGNGVADLRRRMPPPRIVEADLRRRIFNRVDHEHMAG